MKKKKLVGRKKIICSLGDKVFWCCWAYPSEVQKLKIEYAKLKRERSKYTTKIERGEEE